MGSHGPLGRALTALDRIFRAAIVNAAREAAERVHAVVLTLSHEAYNEGKAYERRAVGGFASAYLAVAVAPAPSAADVVAELARRGLPLPEAEARALATHLGVPLAP